MSAQSVRSMIDRLIAFPTVSRDSNLDLIHFVRDYLADLGVESHLVFNETRDKANLYATVGPMIEGGVVLSGHTDVVPVDGQPWDGDPFTVAERDGRLYGRGTCDMKSFIAIALARAPDMLAAGMKHPIHFAFSYDEEVGCLGAPSMIAEIANHLPRPRAVFIGEPTDMKVVTAHKGITGVHVAVRGREAHSSQVHRGVSAVMTGARLVTRIEDIMRDNAARADPASPFAPPYSTLHVGVIQGGTARNIISRDCRFEVDIRTIPEDDPMDFVAQIREAAETLIAPARAIAPEAAISIETSHSAPGLNPQPGNEAETLARALTGDNTMRAVPYVTEGGQYQQAGFAVVICGPGSIDQAHQPNEFIELSQVAAGTAFVDKLIARLAS